ncbi:hypothetical protein MMU07_20635 [Aquiflexum sp. LQ15W]|uniref:hypothetical protein n=1 Tax=Cognataquiflexum nitidum TaxID=2922272 RepID=UPI001F142137|nr:hypothetical protein [Cognataquiflexum nitidum]MCH6201995.1 hypothetical protein [Cognataquiflexum nitidum]
MTHYFQIFGEEPSPNPRKGHYLIFDLNRLALGKAMILLVYVLFMGTGVFAQDNSGKGLSYFRGNISVTNNGLSLIPAFSLGRPAAIFELSMGGERLSFDPELRFALDGKPWSFIFWWRYKIVKTDKFNLHVGAHPAFIFTTTMEPDANGQMVEKTEVQRFFAAEISPTYTISPKTKVSFLYLAGRSLGKVPFALNQFVALGSSFTDISISEKVFFNARPNVFYLKMNEKDGYFASSSLVIGRRNFPISLGGIVSKKIVSEIEVDNWIWNISLIYSFNNEFVKRASPML